jgi:hypothetical protein
VLLLDGGDSWQGSYGALQSRGADMVRVLNALKPDAMTGHWEFTYGAKRVEQLVKELPFPFLAGNVKEATWGDPVFPPSAVFERGGLRIGVIGQAFPYTPVANPRYLIPDWSFGIEEEKTRRQCRQAARRQGRPGGAAEPQRLRTSTASWPARVKGHRRDPDRPHPRRDARAGQGRRHAAGRRGSHGKFWRASISKSATGASRPWEFR